MNEQVLQNLKDVHLPDAIGYWPLAVGWYVVIGLCLLLIFGTTIFVIQYRRKTKAQRLAIKRLKEIEVSYRDAMDASATAYQLNMLLKQVSFAYFPRAAIAPLFGEPWLQFLGEPEWGKQLSELTYQKTATQDLSAIFPQIRKWIWQIRKLPAPRSVA
jgi:hypothetical protein